MSESIFKDKIVLITGASRGIGAEVAKMFASNGAKVIINYFENDLLAQDVLKTIGDQNGMIVKADISSEIQVKNMAKEIFQKYGFLDVIVNNAGIISRSNWNNISIDEWHKIFDVNVMGMWNVIKECQYLFRKRDSNIVNIASIYGIAGSEKELVYSLSKTSVISLSETLAKTFAPDIRVNTIIPGNTETKMQPNQSKISELESRTLLKRSAKKSEIGEAILFLASEKASYITGTSLYVDGGFHCL